jgi:predicted ester cyclase
VSLEENKAFTRQFIEEVLSTGDLERMSDFISPDYVEHSAPPGAPPTMEGVKIAFKRYRAAFPDFKYTVEGLIAEGDLVMSRVTGSGTMQGEWLDLAPTGKHASWSEVHIVRIRDGKFVEHRDAKEWLVALRQLGFTPAPRQLGG